MLPTEGTTVPPRYRYEQIADDLAERIATGEFPPGSKLPSRRELIEHYGVTEPVIDRAMQVLRIKGMTETLPGVGVFVAE
ncbi:winged helix-turn-helix domain-containing protein [Micromonospora carbonacea]|uniref:Transcriptional regulator, GntR family n=1 Tax=Micromonospora carbonacea TaxID=47853 RepID=A0A1C5AVT7_9ACTN|nr:GntR family transcriptional regulator [Micromonospora carbonacea]SCF49256.1 transcriptional regulator, GntR family [Micromonospora carbonacea]